MERLNDIGKKGYDTAQDLSLLSRYDEGSARQIDDLRAQSEALEDEKDYLLKEIEKAKQQLAIVDRSSRLNELYAEQERLEKAISDLQGALPRMHAKVQSFQFDFDVEDLQRQYEDTLNGIDEASNKKETLNRQILGLNEENSNLQRSINEVKGSIEMLNKEIRDIESQTESLRDRIKGFERLVSAIGDKKGSLDNPYSSEIIKIGSDLSRDDTGALKNLSDLCQILINEYSYLTQSINKVINAIRDKIQYSKDNQLLSNEINQLKSQIDKVKAEISSKLALIQEIIQQTTKDKERTLALQSELELIDKDINAYADELAKIKELTRSKDEAVARFNRLFVENTFYSEGIRNASKSYRKIRDIVRKMI